MVKPRAPISRHPGLRKWDGPARCGAEWARAGGCLRGIALAGLIAPWPGQGAAQPFFRAPAGGDAAELCALAARSAARESGVPLAVLTALMLTESGRKRHGSLRPWPWTVNMEGAGHWFETESEARAFVERDFRRGARSFDIGCFQINYRWHHQGFASIDEMFDPRANARYAAQFLRGLFDELGSWDSAAGAYHSRTPELAARYRARFLQHHARITAGDGVAAQPLRVADAPGPDLPAPRRKGGGWAPARPLAPNGYPLLQLGAGRAMGSLVPAGLSTARPLLTVGPRG